MLYWASLPELITETPAQSHFIQLAHISMVMACVYKRHIMKRFIQKSAPYWLLRIRWHCDSSLLWRTDSPALFALEMEVENDGEWSGWYPAAATRSSAILSWLNEAGRRSFRHLVFVQHRQCLHSEGRRKVHWKVKSQWNVHLARMAVLKKMIILRRHWLHLLQILAYSKMTMLT